MGTTYNNFYLNVYQCSLFFLTNAMQKEPVTKLFVLNEN